MSEIPDNVLDDRPARGALLRRRVADGGLWIKVRGESMGRAVADGARVRIVSANGPRRGEVWAFLDGDGRIVVHRYRGRSGDRYWFRGDARRSDDVPVPGSALVGRVVGVDTSRSVRRLGAADRLVGHLRLDLLTARRGLRKWRAARRRDTL